MSGQTAIRDGIEVARDAQAVEALRPDWERLRAGLELPDPNAQLDHFLLVCATKPDCLRPHVIALRRDGEIRALLAARIDRDRFECKIGYQVVFRPRVARLHVVYGGVIAPDEPALAPALLSALDQATAAGEADLVTFAPLNEAGALHRALRAPGAVRDRAPRHHAHWRIRLPESFEAYLGTLSKNERKKSRRRRKRLDEAFGDRVRIQAFRGEAEVDSLADAAESIAETTYQRGMDAGFRNDALTIARLRLAASRGWLRAYVLFLDEVPAAYQLAFREGSGFFAMGRGFDAQHRDLQLGTLLFEHALECAIEEEGVSTFDFGVGDAPHKRAFGNEEFEEIGLHRFPRAPRGRLLALRWTATRAADRFARQLARGEGAALAKRRWRSLLRRSA